MIYCNLPLRFSKLFIVYKPNGFIKLFTVVKSIGFSKLFTVVNLLDSVSYLLLSTYWIQWVIYCYQPIWFSKLFTVVNLLDSVSYLLLMNLLDLVSYLLLINLLDLVSYLLLSTYWIQWVTCLWISGMQFLQTRITSIFCSVFIVYGKPRVCTFDGRYYCFECHENDEYYIPAFIIHNWDFRKHIGEWVFTREQLYSSFLAHFKDIH